MGQIGEMLGGAGIAQSLTAGRGREPFQLGPLPYAFDALEPVIDQETLQTHYEGYHRHYVQRLNEALAEAQVQGVTLDEILARISRYPKAVRVNGGGHWNHTFFWSVMTDKKEDHEITPAVLHAIEDSFKSMDAFRTEFVKQGCDHVGSGWIWLVRNPQGKLRITTTSNNDNPLMDVCETRGTPVLVCDLWEHAYFLKFKSKREEFLRKFIAIVNWARVDALLTGAGATSASGSPRTSESDRASVPRGFH